MKCSSILPLKGGKRQSKPSAKATGSTCPSLNPEVGTPTIQLVGPGTTKEELLELYLEVYKLHRLPGSPPSEPAIWEEIMAKAPDHPHSEEDQTCEATAQSHPGGSHSSRSRAPCRGNDNSVGQSLATV